MCEGEWAETMIEQCVTYTLKIGGRLIVVENVPARVCMETGEQYFAPETVEHLQNVAWGERKPARIIEVPVFDFA